MTFQGNQGGSGYGQPPDTTVRPNTLASESERIEAAIRGNTAVQGSYLTQAFFWMFAGLLLTAAVGVLVQSNFHPPPPLVMDGVPIGALLGEPPATRSTKAGSCIAVVAVDAPLSSHQLQRVARRAGLGLARCGSVAHHGSGEIFVAFAPPARRSHGAAPSATVPAHDLNDVFEAVVDATEGAVLNALWAAPEVVGREGRVGPALPHDDVLGLLAAHGRLQR